MKFKELQPGDLFRTAKERGNFYRKSGKYGGVLLHSLYPSFCYGEYFNFDYSTEVKEVEFKDREE